MSVHQDGKKHFPPLLLVYIEFKYLISVLKSSVDLMQVVLAASIVSKNGKGEFLVVFILAVNFPPVNFECNKLIMFSVFYFNLN